MYIYPPEIPCFAANLKKKHRRQILADALLARNHLLKSDKRIEAGFEALPAGMMLAIDFSPEASKGQLRVKFEQRQTVPEPYYGLRIGYDTICQEFPVTRFTLASSVTPEMCPAFSDMLESGFGHREMQAWADSVYLVAAGIHHWSADLISEFGPAWQAHASSKAAAEATVN